MKAMTQDKYGGADVLQFREIDEPVPGDDDVLTGSSRPSYPLGAKIRRDRRKDGPPDRS